MLYLLSQVESANQQLGSVLTTQQEVLRNLNELRLVCVGHSYKNKLLFLQQT